MLSSNLAIDKLVSSAIERNYEALGIADNDNMHGAVKFYTACKSKGITPIIGVRITLDSAYGYDNAILLYAKNNNGYRNLLKITTKRSTTKDKINIFDIKDLLSDLVVTIPSDEHELVKAYVNSDFEGMQKILKDYLSLKEINNLSLYLGLDLQTKNSKYMLGDLIYFAKQNGITPVAIRKTNYLDDEDYELYKILRSVDLGG